MNTTRYPFVELRRNLAQAMLGLANTHQGGSWSLIRLDEGETATVMTFETTYPFKDYAAKDRQIRHVRVTLEAVEELGPCFCGDPECRWPPDGAAGEYPPGIHRIEQGRT